MNDDVIFPSVLRLQGFGVAFRDRIVIAELNLIVDAPGTVVLMGPSGTGKSTLMRTLAGLNDGVTAMRTWGTATYRGQPLCEGNQPLLVAQNARLLMASVFENLMLGFPDRHAHVRGELKQMAATHLESCGLEELIPNLEGAVAELPLGLQRRLSIARTVAANPALLCVDEATSEMSDAEADAVLEMLALQARQRAVLFCTHNQRHAMALGGRAILMAGGRIQEDRLTAEFFATPTSRPAKTFVRTGSCSLPSPNARPEDLEPDADPPPPLPAAAQVVKASPGPRGFRWIKPGRLAGTPYPGIVQDIDTDLELLQAAGVTTLVCLTDNPVDADHLARYQMTTLCDPIEDMQAPSLEQAHRLCREILRRVAAGETIAVHCRAGLGRTGTILAAVLIREGMSALEALEYIRRLEANYVQSQTQVDFLRRFGSKILSEAE